MSENFLFLSSTLRFGPPFLLLEDRSISWDQLQQSILSQLYYLMLNGAQAQVIPAAGLPDPRQLWGSWSRGSLELSSLPFSGFGVFKCYFIRSLIFLLILLLWEAQVWMFKNKTTWICTFYPVFLMSLFSERPCCKLKLSSTCVFLHALTAATEQLRLLAPLRRWTPRAPKPQLSTPKAVYTHPFISCLSLLQAFGLSRATAWWQTIFDLALPPQLSPPMRAEIDKKEPWRFCYFPIVIWVS